MRGMFSELASIRQEEQATAPPAPIRAARPAARKRPDNPTPSAAPPPLPPAPPPEPATPATIISTTPAASDPASVPHAAAVAPAPTSFDLADYPTRTVTFPVTDQERLMLDELKLEITRLYQPTTTATKERLLRLAIHHLVEEYHQHGAASFVVQRLNKRKK